MVDETNAIGTAWLRLDLLPADRQPAVRDDFRRYVDARLSAYAKLPDIDAAWAELRRARAEEQVIWDHTMAAMAGQTGSPLMLVTQALNAMIDLSSTQVMATRLHPPPILFVVLAVLALVSALVMGEVTAGMSLRWWLHSLAFSVLFSSTFYLILELEYPRAGFLRIHDFDQQLIQLRKDMGETTQNSKAVDSPPPNAP
jgi:hypothetical protein